MAAGKAARGRRTGARKRAARPADSEKSEKSAQSERSAKSEKTAKPHARTGLLGDLRARAGTAYELPAWAIALVVVGLLTLAVLLVFQQRRSDADVELGVLPPIEESMHALAGLTGGTALPGNSVEVIEDGAFFEALLRDAAGARHHVHLETYVWWKGAICERTIEVLADRARAGVEVRLLVDAQGSRPADDALFERLREAGGRVEKYRPLGLRHAHAQNYRDHRKIAVVDGRVAYAFGHGFADEWTGSAQDPDHWRDTAVRLQGPVVNAMQSAFARHWMTSTSEALRGHGYFAEQPAAGAAVATVATSNSGDSLSHVEMLYKVAIASARRTLVIANPYFAPDADIVDQLVEAADRGVEVRIAVPGAHTDARSVQHSSHRSYARLLEHGVRLFEHQETFPHQKVMVVDGVFSHVGSTNLDVRSLEMSDEISVGMLDAATAAALTAAFERDLERCREVTLSEWRERSPWHRALDAVVHLANEQL